MCIYIYTYVYLYMVPAFRMWRLQIFLEDLQQLEVALVHHCQTRHRDTAKHRAPHLQVPRSGEKSGELRRYFKLEKLKIHGWFFVPQKKIQHDRWPKKMAQFLFPISSTKLSAFSDWLSSFRGDGLSTHRLAKPWKLPKCHNPSGPVVDRFPTTGKVLKVTLLKKWWKCSMFRAFLYRSLGKNQLHNFFGGEVLTWLNGLCSTGFLETSTHHQHRFQTQWNILRYRVSMIRASMIQWAKRGYSKKRAFFIIQQATFGQIAMCPTPPQSQNNTMQSCTCLTIEMTRENRLGSKCHLRPWLGAAFNQTKIHDMNHGKLLCQCGSTSIWPLFFWAFKCCTTCMRPQ